MSIPINVNAESCAILADLSEDDFDRVFNLTAQAVKSFAIKYGVPPSPAIAANMTDKIARFILDQRATGSNNYPVKAHIS